MAARVDDNSAFVAPSQGRELKQPAPQEDGGGCPVAPSQGRELKHGIHLHVRIRSAVALS